MSIKNRVQERYNHDSTPRATDIAAFNECEWVEVAVAGKLFVGTVASRTTFDESNISRASMSVQIDKQATQIPEDDKYHDNLPSTRIYLNSGTNREPGAKDDKLSASISTPDSAHGSQTLLGVVGSLQAD